MQLHPRESFAVVRQIEDHTDQATYYVRAVIRNAKTDALITTLNLDDKGSQRFSKVWQVLEDGSGQGFWITIVTSVYTDSGYTTKSQNYGDKMETYLIQERLNANLNQAVHSGQDISYKKVKSLIIEALHEELPKLIKIPKQKDFPMDILLEVLTSNKGEILKAAADNLAAIKNIKIPMPPKLEPLMAELKAFSESVKKNHGEGMKTHGENLRALVKEIRDANRVNNQLPKEILDAVRSFGEKLDSFQLTAPEMEFRMKNPSAAAAKPAGRDRVSRLIKKR